MTLSYPTDDISLAQLKRDIEGYSWSTFRQDILAGLSVSMLTLPQAMAYALLAGLPLSCGLLAAVYSALIAALFGSSRQLIVGPNNTIAILIQSGTAEILFTYYRELTGIERDIISVQIMTQLTLLAGILQVLAGWFHLGRLTQFVSQSVIIGYVAGTALAVIINQLFTLFGIPRLSGAHSLYENVVYLVAHLDQMQWTTVFLGIGSLVILWILKHINSRIPAAFVTIVVAGVVVQVLGLSSYSGSSWLIGGDVEELTVPNVLVVGDTGEVYDLAPTFTLPFLNMRIINGILPVAFAIALLGIMDTTAVAKTIAANTGQRLSTNQEIFGVGIGNLVSTLVGGMPVSGSPSRSGLNFRSGAQTRFAAIYNAFFVAFFVFALGFFVTRIPLAALSALVLITAVGIVNTKQLFLCLRATASDAFVLWTTLLACLFFSLDIAFYVGVILSIILYLKKAAIPQLGEYDIDDDGELKNLDPTLADEHRTIRVIKVEGELFFGSADIFQNTLQTLADDHVSTCVIILQLKNARDIDATTCFALQQLHDFLKESNRHLVACGITPHIWEVLSNSGLVELFGAENLFLFDEKHPHLHMQEAIQWAKKLSSERIPLTPILQVVSSTETVTVIVS